MVHNCSTCGEGFTRLFSLKRHTDRKYPNITLSQTSDATYGNERVMPSSNFEFQHPFTLTQFLWKVNRHHDFTLQQALFRIVPAPQRIVWLYKCWQPIYTIIQSTVRPKVEFMKGIPLGIENDISDDLMSTTSKGPRITEIFYEGSSYHKKLSIVQISQNIYYGKDPAQWRNCHYVVLFKNPNDLQFIMTFARQMNPLKEKEFMSIYEAATDKPHGHLLMDFKQANPVSDRLRLNVLDQNEAEHIKAEESLPDPQFGSSNASVHICETFAEPDNMPSCDDYGLMFDGTHDLLKHVKHWCPDKDKDGSLVNNNKRWLEGEPVADNDIKSEPVVKKRKLDQEFEKEYFMPVRKAFGKLWMGDIKESKKEYMDEGYSKTIAQAKVVNDNIKAIRENLYTILC